MNWITIDIFCRFLLKSMKFSEALHNYKEWVFQMHWWDVSILSRLMLHPVFMLLATREDCITGERGGIFTQQRKCTKGQDSRHRHYYIVAQHWLLPCCSPTDSYMWQKSIMAWVHIDHTMYVCTWQSIVGKFRSSEVRLG